MSHEPITAQNGRYVSTRWALGVVVTLLIASVIGWGKWMQTTMTRDHDRLIEVMVRMDGLDQHMLEVKATGLRTQALVRQVLNEHVTLRLDKNGR